MIDPKDIPILKPENMYTGWYVSPDDPNCRCFVGWLQMLDYLSVPQIHELSVCIAKTAKEIVGQTSVSIAHINDHILKTNEQRAQVWNRARELFLQQQG